MNIRRRAMLVAQILPVVEMDKSLIGSYSSGKSLSIETGVLSDKSNIAATEYINVLDTQTHSASAISLLGSLSVCWYDKYKRFISGQEISSTTTLNPPRHARFVRLSGTSFAFSLGLFSFKRTG